MNLALPRLRKLWFNVHLWLGIALFLVIIPICLTGSYEVWQDEIDGAMHPARQATTAGPLLSPSAYLAAAQSAFADRARAFSLRLPEHAGGPVTVVGIVGGEGGDRAGRRAPQEAGDQRGCRREEAGDAGARAERRQDGPRDAGPQTGRPREDGRGPAAPGAGLMRRPTLTAWLDPATAKVLDVADTSKSFKMTMHRLHGSLLLQGGQFPPGLGRQIVGWIGWALFVSALTGIWLWWPRGAVLKGFRFRRTPDTLLNLHYLTGFWISIPLAALALTGALISFPQLTRSWVGAVAPVSPQAQRGPGGGFGGGTPVGPTSLSPDDAARLAQAKAARTAPGARMTVLSLPTRGRSPAWRVQFQAAGKPLTLAVDDVSGEARVTPERTLPAGDAAIRWNRRIHAGDETGIVWKLIITLAGLAPALLGVTGVIVWARRQMRKLAMRRRLAVSDPVPQPSPAE